jgi:hypothetical protein
MTNRTEALAELHARAYFRQEERERRLTAERKAQKAAERKW